MAELLDPQYGFFVLDNPGAYIVPMYFHSLQEALPQIVSLRPEYYSFVCDSASVGAAPAYSCDNDSWSDEGCFLTNNPNFSVAHWYEVAARYNLTSQISGDIERARATDAAITSGVYSTQDTLGFYFARIGCKWRVVAIDAVSPCSA